MSKTTWSRDELILALDLYFREPNARGNKHHQEVIALSALLNRIARITGGPTYEKYRNASGVSMTLNAFLGYDSAYEGRGLRGTKGAEAVWRDFAGARDLLAQTAAAIKSGWEEIGEPTLHVMPESDEEPVEGRILTMLHQIRERNKAIVGQKKGKVLRESGYLRCEACGFDFQKKYGERGFGFVECHHDRPLCSYRAGDKTQLADLRIICSNCHRMLHRRRPWLTVAALHDLVESTAKSELS